MLGARMHDAYRIGSHVAADLVPGDVFVGATPASLLQFPKCEAERKAFRSGFLRHLAQPLYVDNETGAIVRIGEKGNEND
jgi:hypothetical protein